MARAFLRRRRSRGVDRGSDTAEVELVVVRRDGTTEPVPTGSVPAVPPDAPRDRGEGPERTGRAGAPSAHEPQGGTVGETVAGEDPSGREPETDPVDEAGYESFPASDPPAFWSGPPTEETEPDEAEHSEEP